MQHEDDDQAPDGPQDSQDERPGIKGQVQQAAAAGKRVTGALTGAQFRRQFEDFTDTVTTAVVGVHRDQNELKERVAKLETADAVTTAVAGVHRDQNELKERVAKLEMAGKADGPIVRDIASRMVPALALALSTAALLLSILALLGTF